MKRLRVSSQFNSLFILYIYTAKRFDPANFEMSKIYRGNFNPFAVRHSYSLIPRQSFYEKRAKWLEKIFFSSENAIWSTLLKYQEIDVQIQTFTDEN